MLTKEVCPLSFFTLSPTSQSHTAPVLSVDAENSILIGKGKESRGKEEQAEEQGEEGGGVPRHITSF